MRLVTQGDAYAMTAPRNRKRITSSCLTNSQPTFRNSSEGAGWGYSQSLSTTRDGIPVGGQDRIFRGNQKRVRGRTGQEEAFGRHFNSRGIDRGRHLTRAQRLCAKRSCGTGSEAQVPDSPIGRPLFNSRLGAGPTPSPHRADGRLCHGVRAGRTAGRGAPWTSATIRPCRSPWSEPERYAPRPGQS